MGKVLQIRVSAVTWNDDLLEKNWPQLTDLAFSLPIKYENHGVLEMVRGLSEGLEFMKWSEARKYAMGEGIKKCAKIKLELEKALADWEPHKANDLSNKLEDVLDDLENVFKN